MRGIRNMCMYEMLVRKGVWEGKRSGVLGMDGNIILKLILDGGRGDDCIYLAKVRVQ
jgi:hypothetical protein